MVIHRLLLEMRRPQDTLQQTAVRERAVVRHDVMRGEVGKQALGSRKRDRLVHLDYEEIALVVQLGRSPAENKMNHVRISEKSPVISSKQK